ncbi:hypothetical protein K0T92_10655 [Paenibacillus oenotherae]|uniref:Uncharacterized protein n=1 Tax=Paenibacillus oenotherae TaxID=1435645 RepID=A0ABS7D7S1_9BACL|nr:hypothetical protein [Paenibacillus oenotherae]MBW7475208.1 hypothetical protein [Paenibacillus oenotherae]
MNIVMAGDCEKHDFVLAAAVLLKSYHENKVSIITDDSRHYRYMGGEVSGVAILETSSTDNTDITIYDWHNGYPSGVDDARVVFVTSYERAAIANIERLLSEKYLPSAMIVIEEECKLRMKYIETNFPMVKTLLSYDVSSERKIDWIHDGRVQLKVAKDFSEALNIFLVEVCGIQQEHIKKLWRYARKRG